MVRVTLKNTFLSVDENEEEESELPPPFTSRHPTGRQAASPRSRSAECPSPNRTYEDRACEEQQIEKLNRLLGTELLPSPVRSPLLMSKAPSAGPATPPEMALSADGQAHAHHSGARASGPPTACGGPSAQELKQLQRRLEEVCQPRAGRPRSTSELGPSGTKLRHVTSDGSISTKVPDLAEEDMLHLRARPLRQVWSSTSVSTLASDQAEEPLPAGEVVEFDLTIEEDPLEPGHLGTFSHHNRRWPPAAVKVEPGKPPGKPMPPASPQPTSPQSDEGSPRVHAAGPLRGPRTPWGARPRAPQRPGPLPQPLAPGVVAPRAVPLEPEDAAIDGRRSPLSRRSLPKEYRHGHVPKSADLAEKFKQESQDVAPTTLMIRNIPNHYTQRQLIAELNDLGFTSTFDFLYIPLDKGTMSNVGYAFVNFVEAAWAEKCMAAFQNYRFKRHRKIAAISVAHIQGLEANLAHYENAAVNTAKLKQRRPVIMANISATLHPSDADPAAYSDE